jgi:hypothetical protein
LQLCVSPVGGPGRSETAMRAVLRPNDALDWLKACAAAVVGVFHRLPAAQLAGSIHKAMTIGGTPAALFLSLADSIQPQWRGH